jgi:branched-chain amino acid transport system substrate-binding protein
MSDSTPAPFNQAEIKEKEDLFMKGFNALLPKAVLVVCSVLSLLCIAGGGLARAAEPIRIGTIFSITGWGGFIGTPQKEAFVALVDDINKKGGVDGRQLEFLYEDDKSVPTNAVIAATKLIKDKKVVAMVGTSLSDSAIAIVPICEQEQTPFINSGPAAIPWKKWAFSVGPGDVRCAAHLIEFVARDLGAKRIALLHGSDAAGMLQAKVINSELPKYPGASIVIQERFEPTDTNMVPQLTKVKGANPDVIILAATGGPGSVVAKNYKQLGMTTQVVGGHSLTMPDFVKIAGKFVDEAGWIFLSQPMMVIDKMSPDDPYRKNVYEPFKKIMQNKFGPNMDVTLFHGSCYDAIMGVVEAMKMSAPNITRASIRDNLEKVKIDGFLGTFGPTPADHQACHEDPMRPMILKNGAWLPYVK